ncbi:class I SAM-dependent methyltransferase [Urbifossiella limnaea]|uniref:Release factor glutamine methyltransferase n=1 Tax=Urbifossiella limnaea TaxID=2528023 RepID=A0A517Y051_9BACT|nr:class I SAM-dependent methyltransferase [Urbifossiella limnaea]QDU23135.1 Release factor glutamine methyltransferase [Urbifossiella limnaea]
MDVPTARHLTGPDGTPVLAAAAAALPGGTLGALAALRKRFAPELAAAAVEVVTLRERARPKFAAAGRMWFTREALEQASGDLPAAHRAERLKPFAAVLDLGCGIGADALALAAAGCRVEAVDADLVRLVFAEANAVALGVADRVRFHLGDLLTLALPPADAAYTDPGRRAGDRRFLDPDQYEPPLSAVLARFPAGFPLAAKIAPGVPRDALARFDAEAEFVSAGGELKECVLWFGPLRTVGRRATLLPGPHTLAAEADAEMPYAEPVGEYLFDPDPAVIRADLVGLLAAQLGAAPVEPGVALLTGPDAASPFAAAYRVEHVAPLDARKLRDHFRAVGVGRVTVLKRAIDADADAFRKGLKLGDGGEHRHVVLTRAGGKAVAVVATGSSP